ncbi:MAG: hypothetical protein NVSMB51_05110 [Solirubrobacteraceae bacterium]
MNNTRALATLAVVAGIALLVVGGVYFADTAKSLPSFFPGHDAASTTHHIKHGIAAIVVALGCFAFAWFQSGPKPAASA